MVKTNLNRGNIHEITAKLGIYVKNLAESALSQRGIFTIALSGGSSMEILSKALLRDEIRGVIDWNKWHVFWVDERCVPEDSLQSNYGKARELLLEHVDIPEYHIHHFNGRMKSDEALNEYVKELSRFFLLDGDESFPKFDLILLGVGEDGHIGSLFQGYPALEEVKRPCLIIKNSPKAPKCRMTLTLPVINWSRNVAVVAIGKSKASVVKKIFYGGRGRKLPIEMVNPLEGRVDWFLDEDAFGGLNK